MKSPPQAAVPDDLATREGSTGQFIGGSGAEHVSVIIPAYNVAPYIAQTLHSVFAQTKPAFEVIVVNDGSPDTAELEEVLRPFRDRIVYLKQENRGLSGARNTGIRAATGDLIALVDGRRSLDAPVSRDADTISSKPPRVRSRVLQRAVLRRLSVRRQAIHGGLSVPRRG